MRGKVNIPILDGGLKAKGIQEALEDNQLATVSGFLDYKKLLKKDWAIGSNIITLDNIRSRMPDELGKCSWANNEQGEDNALTGDGSILLNPGGGYLITESGFDGIGGTDVSVTNSIEGVTVSSDGGGGYSGGGSQGEANGGIEGSGGSSGSGSFGGGYYYNNPDLTKSVEGGNASGWFISTWKTNNAGVSSSTQIKLPLVATGVYNFIVAWGDGNTDRITNANYTTKQTHTYASAGTYTITFSGDITGWRFNSGETTDKLKLLSISSWGCLNIGNETEAFCGCANLTMSEADNIDLSGVTILTSMFEGCSSLTNITWLAYWSVSAVTDTSRMFKDCSVFNGNVATFNMANVTNISDMFNGASSFNKDISGWDTGKVANADRTFKDASAFVQNLKSWDVRALTSADEMFNGLTMETEVYDELLVAWAGQTGIEHDVVFDAGGSKYTDAGGGKDARAILTDTYGWVITDGGEEVSGYLFIPITYDQTDENKGIIVFMISIEETFPYLKDISTISGISDFIYLDYCRMDYSEDGDDTWTINISDLNEFSSGVIASDGKISLLLEDELYEHEKINTYNSSTGALENTGLDYDIDTVGGDGKTYTTYWGKISDGPDMFCISGDYIYQAEYARFISKVNRLTGVRSWHTELPWEESGTWPNPDWVSESSDGYSAVVSGGYLWINTYNSRSTRPSGTNIITLTWFLTKYTLDGVFDSEISLVSCVSGSPNYYSTYPGSIIADSSGNIYSNGFDGSISAKGNCIKKITTGSVIWTTTISAAGWQTEMLLSTDESQLFYCNSILTSNQVGCINTTTGDISWTISITGATYGYYSCGLAFDGTYLYVLSHDWDKVIKITRHNPVTGAEV